MIRAVGAAALGIFGARRVIFMAAAFARRQAESGAGPHAPSLTVIMPARDEAATLALALERLADAEPPPGGFSVVLVDDASTDATGEIMERFASGRQGWSVIRGSGSGKAAALNAALESCAGADLVAVCDADVRLDPGSLHRLFEAFADRGVGAASGLLWPANATATPVARYCALELWQHQLITSAAKDRLGLNPPALGWASCYRRDALAAVGGFRVDSVGEDVAASNALTSAGWRTRFVPGAVVRGNVPETVTDYWHQHVRWASGLHGAAPSRSPQGTTGRARRLEAWLLSAGYLDRIVLGALLAYGAPRRRVPVVPLAYLAVSALESLLALRLAGVPARRVPGFAAAAALMLPIDVAMATAGSLAALLRRRPAWRSPRRIVVDQSRSSTWRSSAWPASDTRSRPSDFAR